jgi:bifunctional enzyme CysN/CysC
LPDITNEAGAVIWLTGLSASGKTTLAMALAARIAESGTQVQVLDGDELRATVNKDLGFSPEARAEAVRRAAELARALVVEGNIVLVAMVSPFEEQRNNARAIIHPHKFLQIWVNTAIEVCITRDPKGLYKKSLDGKLPDFTGVGQEYQVPANPDLIIDGSDDLDLNVERVLELLQHQS